MAVLPTGEYCIPEKSNSRVVNDHIERYKFAAKYVKEKRVLDIACGVGYGSYLFSKSDAKEVVGVDISDKLISYAKKKYKAKKLQFKIGNIVSFKSKTLFDVIVCYETIEHIEMDEKAILNLVSLLVNDGLLIISSPNRNITSPQAKSIKDKPLNKYHIREYTISELTMLLKKMGFAVNPKNVYGQRLRLFFKNKILDGIYNVLLNPNYRSNSKVLAAGILTPRYITLIARKQRK